MWINYSLCLLWTKTLSKWALLNCSSCQTFKKIVMKFYFQHWSKHTFIPLYNEIVIFGTFTHYLIQISLWRTDTKADIVMKPITMSRNWPSWENLNYFSLSFEKKELSEPDVLRWATWQENNRRRWRKRQTMTISLSHFWSSFSLVIRKLSLQRIMEIYPLVFLLSDLKTVTFYCVNCCVTIYFTKNEF